MRIVIFLATPGNGIFFFLCYVSLNNLSHMESGPQFKLSKRREKAGIESTTPCLSMYKASGFP